MKKQPGSTPDTASSDRLRAARTPARVGAGDAHQPGITLAAGTGPDIRRVRVAVIVPVIGAKAGNASFVAWKLQEASGLAAAIDAEIAAAGEVSMQRVRPSTLLGKGKVEELKAIVKAEDIELVLVDHALTPGQQRNLERAWGCKVLDRTGLILEIFARRARTREGRLQVELAHLTYQKSRLVRSWTHLERQRGGLGFVGGPGETQQEADRRMIQERIEAIRRELAGVMRTRGLHRAGRKRIPYRVVALVGYTNAGKSTLFNRLTGAGVVARDQLFATLDPTMRELELPSGRRIILSDTVGFVSELPTMLVAAFRATLEEVVSADLILHVRDISSSRTESQRDDVNDVLASLQISHDDADARILEVWNKADLIGEEKCEEIENQARRHPKGASLLSSVTGEGVERLLTMIDERLGAGDMQLDVLIEPGDGALLAWLYRNGDVLRRDTGKDGRTLCKVRLNQAMGNKLLARIEAGTGARLVE